MYVSYEQWTFVFDGQTFTDLLMLSSTSDIIDASLSTDSRSLTGMTLESLTFDPCRCHRIVGLRIQ